MPEKGDAMPELSARQNSVVIADDREMSSDEMRTTNRVSPASTLEIHPSNFASLPGQVFYSTQIVGCLWFHEKNEPACKCIAASENELAFTA